MGRRSLQQHDSAYYIQIEDIFKNTSEDLLYTEDYFHPNDRGYELIASRIYQSMEFYRNGRTTIVEASAKGDEKQQ